MKKYFILTILTLCLSLPSFSQYHQKRNHHVGDKSLSIGAVSCGVVLGIIGGTTTPDWKYSGSSTNQINGNSYYPVQNKPFFEQGPQMLCISTGVILTITGLISLMSSR